MNAENMKIVDFNTYCNKCRHKDVDEAEKPCFDCLAEPARQYSQKPLKFEENVRTK